MDETGVKASDVVDAQSAPFASGGGSSSVQIDPSRGSAGVYDVAGRFSSFQVELPSRRWFKQAIDPARSASSRVA